VPRPPVLPSPFSGLAARDGLAYTGLTVDGDGVVGRRADGRFGFTRLQLRVELETDPSQAEHARELAEQAEQTCLVSVSLDLPVKTVIEVRRRAAS
jgi:organic hydroperoxide reductase OsmC/OhrA